MVSIRDFLIYGAGIAGFCMLCFGAGCSLSDWLKDRREDMRLGRALRLGQMAHDYTVAPDESVPFDQAGYEDFFVMVDLSDDPEWIADGIEQLSIDSTWSQRPDDEIGELAA